MLQAALAGVLQVVAYEESDPKEVLVQSLMEWEWANPEEREDSEEEDGPINPPQVGEGHKSAYLMAPQLGCKSG